MVKEAAQIGYKVICNRLSKQNLEHSGMRSYLIKVGRYYHPCPKVRLRCPCSLMMMLLPSKVDIDDALALYLDNDVYAVQITNYCLLFNRLHLLYSRPLQSLSFFTPSSSSIATSFTPRDTVHSRNFLSVATHSRYNMRPRTSFFHPFLF